MKTIIVFLPASSDSGEPAVQYEISHRGKSHVHVNNALGELARDLFALAQARLDGIGDAEHQYPVCEHLVEQVQNVFFIHRHRLLEELAVVFEGLADSTGTQTEPHVKPSNQDVESDPLGKLMAKRGIRRVRRLPTPNFVFRKSGLRDVMSAHVLPSPPF